MEQMNDLKALLRHDVMMLQSTEEQIIEAMPAMIAKASNPQLKQALEEHLRITERQRDRLEQVEQMLGASEEDVTKYSGILATVMGGTKCQATAGIIEENQKMMTVEMSDAVADAALIGGSQKIEHLEIACYGTARSYAQELGLTDVAQLLEQTLEEEKEADERLTALAESRVNQRAQAGAMASI